jgi:ribosomal protein S18 acetylase RimI-like enzyme
VKKNKVYFTPVDANGISQIIHLAKSVWWTTYPSFLPEHQIEFMLESMYNTDVISTEIENNVIWKFITFEDNAIGFYSYSKEDDSSLKLHKFYILSEFQRMGIGKLTMDSLFQIAKSSLLSHIKVNVNRYNQNAINAYKKYGFIISKSIDINFHDYILNDYIMTYNILQ